MLHLSHSLTHDNVAAVTTLVNGQRFQPALAHPGDAEADDAAETYQAWLWTQLHDEQTSAYKHVVRLARALRHGQTVIIKVHQNATHGDILAGAIRFMAVRLPEERQRPAPDHAGSAHFLPGLEAFEPDELLDQARFVWVVGRQVTHLAYLWDIEGRYTALVPGHGLVKLARYGVWHFVRHQAALSPSVRFARLPLTAHLERLFTPLVQHQQALETTDAVRRKLPYTGHGLAGSALPSEPRYDPWDLAPLDDIEPPADPAAQAHELVVRKWLTPPGSGFDFFSLLPNKYQGEHVKPVIKTKPDGSRWVLTPQMQARGALHLYQRMT